MLWVWFALFLVVGNPFFRNSKTSSRIGSRTCYRTSSRRCFTTPQTSASHSAGSFIVLPCSQHAQCTQCSGRHPNNECVYCHARSDRAEVTLSQNGYGTPDAAPCASAIPIFSTNKSKLWHFLKIMFEAAFGLELARPASPK